MIQEIYSKGTLLQMKKARLKQLIQARKYDMADFWTICPFEPSLIISKSRKLDYAMWRHVALTWCILSDESLTEAGRMFERDHATVYHSMNVVLNALNQPNQYPEIYAIVTAIAQWSTKETNGTSDKTTASALNLEKALSNMRPWFFDPNQFYCQSMVIAQKMGDKPERCTNQCNACKSMK